MTTQRYEIEAWLGDGHDLSPEQVAQLQQVADEIGQRYPDHDDQEERDAALTMACRLMVEDPEAVVQDVAADLDRARAAERRAMAALRQGAIMMVRPRGPGMESQQGYAQAVGVDRSTVLDWLGLRRR